MNKIIKVIGWVIMLAIVSLGLTVNSYAAKPSDYGLKEGDLISAVFSDDPDVYIVNDSGYKRLFLNPSIFNFYGHLGGFFNIKLVSNEVRDSFITSGLFRDCETNDPKVYGVDIDGEDTGKLHWVNVSGESASFDDSEFFKKVFCVNNKELNWYSKGDELKSAKDIPKYERMHTEETVTTQEKISENAKIKDVGQSIICHYPPGNAAAYQTITVDASALRAHLDHGDVIGVCPSLSPTPIPTVIATPTPTPTVTASPTVTPTPTPVVTSTTKIITATAETGGTISPDGSVVVTQGANKTFTITANAGYAISSVVVDGVYRGAVSTYTFTNVTSAHSIVVTFVQSCSLTVSIAPTTPAAQNISAGQSAVSLVKFNAIPNCDGTLISFAVSLLPMPNGYQNISTIRLYDDASGLQLGTAQSVTVAGMNFPSVNAPLTANQTLVLRVVGDVSPSAANGSTVYGTFGGSWGVTGSNGAIGNNASSNIIYGNTMTVVAGSSNPQLSNSQPPIPSSPTPTSYSYSGSVGTPYTYTTMIYPDPDGNQVKATFDWGDGTTTDSSFVIPVSGQSFSSTHSWSTNGVYSVKAKEVDSTGLSSAWSSAAIYSTITITGVAAADTALPSTPTGLTASVISSSQINLSWTASTDNVGVTGYKIYRGGTQIATSTATSYSNTGLSSSTSYSYTVAAYDAADNLSSQSGSVGAATSAVDTTLRIMYWSGKVNQHVDISGNWLTDSDGVSGADLDKLTYCKKFFPNTIGTEDYMLETTNTWHDRGNVGGPYTSTKMSTKCL